MGSRAYYGSRAGASGKGRRILRPLWPLWEIEFHCRTPYLGHHSRILLLAGYPEISPGNICPLIIFASRINAPAPGTSYSESNGGRVEKIAAAAKALTPRVKSLTTKNNFC